MLTFLLEVFLPKVGGFFLALLKNKYVQIFLAFAAVALVSAGLTWHKVSHDYDVKIKAQQDEYTQQLAQSKQTVEKINTVVVTKYRDRIQKVYEKQQTIDTQIDASEEVKNEDSSCVLGPDFVRLYNDAARAVPDAQRGIDETAPEGTEGPRSGRAGAGKTDPSPEGK
jgi:predicted transcriptional regulator